MSNDRGRGKSFDDGEDEDLDPRVQLELEKLNAATDGINHLETEFNEAQIVFQKMMQDATMQLRALHQKLGKCVDKARPYYEALKAAKIGWKAYHDASLAFESAQTKCFNAKKRAIEAENQLNSSTDGRFNTMLLESLNQATTEVMESSLAYDDCWKIHCERKESFGKKHQALQDTYKSLKNQVGKSRSYFELKSNLNKMLEVQKQRLEKIQEGIQLSKNAYSDTLHNLETISADIHESRDLKRQSQGKEDSMERTNRDMEIIRTLTLDDRLPSHLLDNDDTRSIDSGNSEAYDDSQHWYPVMDDAQSTTSSRDLEYNLLRLSRESSEEPAVKKEPPGFSTLVLNVNDAMKQMQGDSSSPCECITSHSVHYSQCSSFSPDDIDCARKDATVRAIGSFNDLSSNHLMIECPKRATSLPSLIKMSCDS